MHIIHNERVSKGDFRYHSRKSPVGEGHVLRQRGLVPDSYCHKNVMSQTIPNSGHIQQQAFISCSQICRLAGVQLI